jgi:hypothetical protein
VVIYQPARPSQGHQRILSTESIDSNAPLIPFAQRQLAAARGQSQPPTPTPSRRSLMAPPRTGQHTFFDQPPQQQHTRIGSDEEMTDAPSEAEGEGSRRG